VTLPASQPQRVVVIGGGPGGYEAALVARRLGADVTVVERQGLGGAAVLTDVVPSKTLIATAEWMTIADGAAELGIRLAGPPGVSGSLPVPASPATTSLGHTIDLAAVNTRVRALAAAQSADIRARLDREGVRMLTGTGRLEGPSRVRVSAGAEPADDDQVLDADVVLVATGATPRVLPEAVPDGERILTWTQLYDLTELPEHLVVVGSGVTGAEFAGAYTALGAQVTLVSSRDRVLPGEDGDAAELIEDVFKARGMNVLSRSRAAGARRVGDRVEVTLGDGRVVEGSHVLLAVGSVPTTAGLGLEESGVRLRSSGHIEVDRVSRTSVRGVYAAGDVTGVWPLASIAATQGRTAMAHALGDAVVPLELRGVAANIFTAPEIATVGWNEKRLVDEGVAYRTAMLPLARNPRAKMQGTREGFVKLFVAAGSGTILGAVLVGPRASESVYPLTIAVAHRLTADQLSGVSTVYPSLSGTISEVARILHQGPSDED
jgi:NAD(P)H dehydrogenase (quinone)